MLELLSPAKNLTTGKAAILSGADAVYIGAERFGARAAVGNTLEDIRELAEFAHQFNARVYVTLNTLLYDDELATAEKMCNELYEAGVDALIIQDAGILKMNLPPIALHASTQMHNNTPERVQFLEDAGLQRVVLARELTLEQIAQIKKKTSVELEAFIHGSLCVSYSGRCYLSEVMGGRSANRGECAQPCRNCYSLTDKQGNVLVADKHLLSLKDLNLSCRIGPMMDAGISSFKIEGRLKDIDYVKNVTAYYRQLIDKELEKRPWLKRASSGTTFTAFEPDPSKSFNRGYTEYFISGREKCVTNPSTPKSEGRMVGTVISVAASKVKVRLSDLKEGHRQSVYINVFENGDGLCWYDESGKLHGTRINIVKDDYLLLNDVSGLKPGTHLMRNHDKAFAELLSREDSAKRTINISLILEETSKGFLLSGRDEDGITSEIELATEKIPAKISDNGYIKLIEQLRKSGNTIFNVTDVRVLLKDSWFFKPSVINMLRRDLLEKARQERIKLAVDRLSNHSSSAAKDFRNKQKNTPVYSPDPLSEKENITNSLAAGFYRECGITDVESLKMQQSRNKAPVTGALMTTKMCIKYELGKCPIYQEDDPTFPKTLYLSSNNIRFRLSFDCKECIMRLYASS